MIALDAFLTTTILIISHSLFFLCGLAVANRYNDKAANDTKDALERQFLRLKAGADADDPCKPYKKGVWFPAPVVTPGFEEPKQVLPQSFEEHLKSTGQATAMLSKKRSATNKQA